MVIVLKPATPEKEIQALTESLLAEGVKVNPVIGSQVSILGLVGDTGKIDAERIKANEYVDSVMRVVEPYKKANRKFHPEDTVITVNGNTVGGKKLAMIAGPCSVESEEQIVTVAEAVKKGGANFLRGGAFKPRTSPYASTTTARASWPEHTKCSSNATAS